MTQEFKKIDSTWFRFGEGVVQMNFSLPETLKMAVKEEARDRGVSASAFITNAMLEVLSDKEPVKELKSREVPNGG